MVDHMIVTWEGKKGNLFCQIRNKAKEGRSFENTLKRKEGRSLGNGGSISQNPPKMYHKQSWQR